MELKCSVTKALRRGGHPVTLQLKRFLCADEDSCTAPKRVKTGIDFLKYKESAIKEEIGVSRLTNLVQTRVSTD